ncbi:FAD-binding dehydrogenase [Macrococcus equipercicus]|uniref:FAD-binding dehydrogenase n=1 Tax=Macrococcus equipercicus TaxID=69967 RepID=A0ABQ6R7B2_9STAP|nr:FAD-binding dehydrogenase [Macrococcus equipercicus]KAA1038365.1 FAD-binding dehydrogenase [Macrococcus equipercicus]
MKKVFIIGAGLSGLTAAAELLKAGHEVVMLDQEPRQAVGGQAFWSFGGLFLVDSTVQRKYKVKDSYELALNDWLGTARFDRLDDEDHWASAWAEAYVRFAAFDKEDYLKSMGIKLSPVLGWAERGGTRADGHGNSVPRFHITWGTGPGLVQPFADFVLNHKRFQLLERHQVTDIKIVGHQITAVSGNILVPSDVERGAPSSREVIGQFAFDVDTLIITTGGIGANHELIKQNWPARLGRAPEHMVQGVPDSTDGRMLQISEDAGVRLVNKDRMWHYTEGLKNHTPIWNNHGIRIIPGPSSMWFDAEGNRFDAPDYPGFDTLHTLESIMKTGYDYSWFVLTEDIMNKEFALSGSEQNPDLTNKDIRQIIRERLFSDGTGPVNKFKTDGEDFVRAANLSALVRGMNKLAGSELINYDKLRRQIEARDSQLDNPFSKDPQITAIHDTRHFLGDKLVRTAKPHKLLDGRPLIAVRLNIISRKTLGGIQTDLNSQVFHKDGRLINGLYAAGEVAGFGGGGVHGYGALEGTFLGGCIFSGLRAAAGINES